MFFHECGEPWDDDQGLKDIYCQIFHVIRDRNPCNRRSQTYLRYLNGNDYTLNQAMDHIIEQVYRLQNHSFEINLSFSTIFQNRETQEYKICCA